MTCGCPKRNPGDLDGDGTVGTDDATYLLYHVFFGDRYPLDRDADFDGNGIVDCDDAMYLLYHVFFPEKYPL